MKQLKILILAIVWMISEWSKRRSAHLPASLPEAQPLTQLPDWATQDSDGALAGREALQRYIKRFPTWSAPLHKDYTVQAAVNVIRQEQEQHGLLEGPRGYEVETEPGEAKRQSPREVIRAVLVRFYGVAWEDAQFAHFHTTSGNCIFVAITTLRSDGDNAILACRVIEVNEKGQFLLPSPVKEDQDGDDNV